MPLSDSFIQSVIKKIDSPEVIGVGIAGSYARGQESKYSDVVDRTLQLIKEAGY